MSLETQLEMRQKVEAINDFLKDLSKWQKEAKENEEVHDSRAESQGDNNDKKLEQDKNPIRTKNDEEEIPEEMDEKTSKEYERRGKEVLGKIFSEIEKEEENGAEEIRMKGNKYFEMRNYNKAIELYTESIDVEETAQAYANRAMCYLKKKNYKKTIEDSTEAIRLDNCYVKAYQRRSVAYKELKQSDKALIDIEMCLRLTPTSVIFQKEFQNTLKSFSNETNTKLIDIKQKIHVTEENNLDNKEYIFDIPPKSKRGNFIEKEDGIFKQVKNNIVLDNDVESVFPKEKISIFEETNVKDEKINSTNVNVKDDIINEKPISSSSIKVKEISDLNIKKDEKWKVTNAAEFEAVFKKVKNDEKALLTFLKDIDPNKLQKLIKTSLTSSVLYVICITVLKHIDNEIERNEIKNWFIFLKEFVNVNRFQILCMCLKNTEKDNIQEYINKIKNKIKDKDIMNMYEHIKDKMNY